MNKDDVLLLIKAGFSKDEIVKILDVPGSQPGTEAKQVLPKKEQEEPKEDTPPVEETKEVIKEEKENNKEVEQMQTKIDELTKLVQAQNISNSSANVHTETIDDVLNMLI